MKKILEINNNNYGSTGTIMLNIAITARGEGFKVYTSCKNSKQANKFQNVDHFFIGNRIERIFSEELAYYTGLKDHFNLFSTLSLINKIKEIKPDLIHLHNIHDTYINLKLFFNFIKKSNIPVVWTLHDTWPITGKCVAYQLAKCSKWKTGCSHCPNLKKYPETLIDKTNILWKAKQEYLIGINNLMLVTPSKWLANEVSQSFYKQYPLAVINNGIDLNKFKYTESNFRKKNSLEDKIILLGVATNWYGTSKGVDVFNELANRLPNNYQIILVGTNDEVDKTLNKKILSIHRTYNQEELIEIYSSADLYINPTREDNLPTVNIEALACGLPVITFNTGGSPEIIDKNCGSVLRENTADEMEKEILRVIKEKPYTKEACIKRAQKYNMDDKFKEYVELYKKMLIN